MMRRLLWSICGGVILVLAACGGDGDDRAQTISQPTATPVASAALPTTSGSSPASSAATATAARSAVTQETLKGALLTLQDMPTGWTTNTEQSDDESTDTICDISSAKQQRLAVAEVEFKKSDLGPFFNELIGVYEPSAAKALLDNAIRILESCREWKTTLDGDPATVKVSPLSFPKIGEQTFAFRMSIDTGSLPIQADVVYARDGDLMLVTSNITISLAGPDSALTESLTKTAHERIAKLSLGR